MNHKIPNASTTIFTVMSGLATKYNAINLSQGFPDFDIDPKLGEAVKQAIDNGFNQYAPMLGLVSLRQAIADKIFHFQNVDVNVETEITITPGATYGIYTAFTSILNSGDEVIVLEPAYDSYIPNIKINGGVPVSVPLTAPNFDVDWDKVKNAITKKTKVIIFNNPHNPCGTIWKQSDFETLADIVVEHNLYVIADEVYEHLVYDDAEHISVLAFPELRKRTFAIYSFGKVFHNTGWKMGYCVAPAELSQQFRMAHQYFAFSVNTPMQQALATYIPNYDIIKQASTLLQSKRDLLLDVMKKTKFNCLKPAQGSYFQLFDYSAVSNMPDIIFAEWLTKEHGVATIPLSPFYSSEYSGTLLRFCFAKKDETLKIAASRLQSL